MEYEHLYDVLSEDLTIRCNNSIDEIYLFHEDTFEFAHSSYIVNLENIKSVFDDYIIMQDGVRLNMSRSKNKIFHSKVNKFVKNKYKREGITVVHHFYLYYIYLSGGNLL